jgi:hypothetical protein
MTFGRSQELKTRQFICQLAGFMDQDWQMLRADPMLFTLILEK